MPNKNNPHIESCRTCSASRLGPDALLVCQAHPPQIVASTDPDGKPVIRAIRLNVAPGDWCREYQFTTDKKTLPEPPSKV